MKFRYQHLSPGYVGCYSDEQTLNAAFNGLLQQQFQACNDIMTYPQRIPKIGFFDELCELEYGTFSREFNNRRIFIVNQLKKLANKHIPDYTQDIRPYFHWVNSCLRNGCFTEIIHSSSLLRYMKDHNAEFNLFIEIAKSELQLSNDLPIPTNHCFALADHHLPNKNVSDREKMMLLNHLIVTFYRHQTDHSLKHQVYRYAKQYHDLLEKQTTHDFMNQLHCSIGYRGLAMVSEFGAMRQSEFLTQAEALALNISSCKQHEIIVLRENQAICYQSFAKWHQQHKDYKQSENYLQKMVLIDPYDSTGHSELGFHNLQRENYDNALACFKKAMILGPPGTGMNAYYYAKCLEILGQQDEAIYYLHEAIQLDKQGLSPWLDLLEFSIKQNDLIQAKQIAKHILVTTTLFEQLEHNEITQLHHLLH